MTTNSPTPKQPDMFWPCSENKVQIQRISREIVSNKTATQVITSSVIENGELVQAMKGNIEIETLNNWIEEAMWMSRVMAAIWNR